MGQAPRPSPQTLTFKTNVLSAQPGSVGEYQPTSQKATKSNLMTEKNKLQARIIEYTKRKEKAKEQRRRLSRSIRNHDKNIRTLRRIIARIEAQEATLWAIQDRICDFMGIKTLRMKGKDRSYSQARWLLCKAAMEAGVTGQVVGDFLGIDHTYPPKLRTDFTRSFKTNKINHQLWINFKQHGTGQKMAA